MVCKVKIKQKYKSYYKLKSEIMAQMARSEHSKGDYITPDINAL